jgi:hypothetical protein
MSWFGDIISTASKGLEYGLDSALGISVPIDESPTESSTKQISSDNDAPVQGSSEQVAVTEERSSHKQLSRPDVSPTDFFSSFGTCSFFVAAASHH